MFVIASQTVRDISRYSAISSEKELLLLPGTVLIVEGILPQSDLTIIQMKEKIDPRLSLLPASTPTQVQGNSRGNVPPREENSVPPRVENSVPELRPEIIKIILSFFACSYYMQNEISL